MDKRFQTAVKAMICNEQGKYLILEKNPDQYKTKITGRIFDLPGGRALYGEGLSEALEREIHEETGLTLKGAQIINAKKFLWMDEIDLTVVYYQCFCHSCEEVQISDEHIAYCWVEIDEIKTDKEIPQWLKDLAAKIV